MFACPWEAFARQGDCVPRWNGIWSQLISIVRTNMARSPKSLTYSTHLKHSPTALSYSTLLQHSPTALAHSKKQNPSFRAFRTSASSNVRCSGTPKIRSVGVQQIRTSEMSDHRCSEHPKYVCFSFGFPKI